MYAHLNDDQLLWDSAVLLASITTFIFKVIAWVMFGGWVCTLRYLIKEIKRFDINGKEIF